MKYVRQFKQKTIKSDDPMEFDQMINAVYMVAAGGGKEPEIHYYDGMGLCASVRYFVNEMIPEDTKDEYEMLGDYRYCVECPLFKMPEDRRVKRTICEKGHRTYTDSKACNDYYVMLKEGLLDEPDEN